MYKVAKHLDWISGTSFNPKPFIFDDIISEDERPPLKNYNKMYRYNSGAMTMWHTEQQAVGVHTVISGEPLGILRGYGHSDHDILEDFISRDYSFSRIDMAITSHRYEYANGQEIILEHEFTPDDMMTEIDTGKMRSRLKRAKPQPDESGKNQETVYIGSRASRNRLFKCYDKGVELKLDRFKIIRYELQSNRGANVVVRHLMKGVDIGALMRRYVDFPEHPIWLHIMAAEPAKITQLEDSLTVEQRAILDNEKRWNWIIETCAKAIARGLDFDNLSLGVTDYESWHWHEFIKAIEKNRLT